MDAKQKKISLGFTSQQFDEGVHICQIFNNDEERHATIVDFIVSGLNAGQKNSLFL